MTLHPTIAAFVAGLPHDHGVPDPAVLRQQEESRVPLETERVPVLPEVTDRVIQAAHGEVPVRIYRREHADRDGVMVYFHGGAFFLGSLDTHDHVARMLAQHPAELGWDEETLVVAGDGSGGNFAAVVAARAKDDGVPVSHQVLFYPLLDLDFDQSRFPSLWENAAGHGLEYDGLAPWNRFYEVSGADPSDPLASPFKRADLSGVAPTLPEYYRAFTQTAEFIGGPR